MRGLSLPSQRLGAKTKLKFDTLKKKINISSCCGRKEKKETRFQLKAELLRAGPQRSFSRYGVGSECREERDTPVGSSLCLSERICRLRLSWSRPAERRRRALTVNVYSQARLQRLSHCLFLYLSLSLSVSLCMCVCSFAGDRQPGGEGGKKKKK